MMGRVWVCVAVMMAWGCGGQEEAAPGAARPVAPVAQPPAPKVLEHVTNGYTHCRLLEGGDVECWGKNRHGQVGDGTIIERAAPVVVLRDAKLLSMGKLSSCAVKRDDTLWCWGTASGMQGSLPNLSTVLTPMLVAHVPGATQIAKGRSRVYVATEDGALRAIYNCDQQNVCVDNLDIGGVVVKRLVAYFDDVDDDVVYFWDGDYVYRYGVGMVRIGSMNGVLDSKIFAFNEMCFLTDTHVRCFGGDQLPCERDVSEISAKEFFGLSPMTFGPACFVSEARDILCVRQLNARQEPRKIASLEHGERLFKHGERELCALRDSDQRVRCFDDKHAYRTEDTARLVRRDVSRRVDVLRRDIEARTHGPEPEPPGFVCGRRSHVRSGPSLPPEAE